MLPLQITFLEEGDPRASMALLGLIVAGIVILIVVNIKKYGTGGGRSLPRRFSPWVLKRAASAYGLDRDQIALLEPIFRRGGVTNPESTLANVPVLDRHFKRAYKEIEKTADTEIIAEETKSLLFSIREAVEQAQSGSGKISSSRRLSDSMAATILTPKAETYPIKIISAKGDQLLVECPRSAVGTPLRLSRGTKVQLSFYTKSSQGYRIETRVLGLLETPRGPSLQLAHSDKVLALPNRRHKRRQTHLSCFFSLVRVEDRLVGKKTEKKTIVDDRRSLGTIMDVSAGGCSIKSAASLSSGVYLRIEFDDPHDKTLAALGRVIRTNKTGMMGGIMHIQFIKIPRRTLNGIHALVYEYDQD